MLSGMVQPLQLNCTFDMMVVIDGSSGISSHDFDLQLQFLTDFVAEFTISPDLGRIGIVQFSSVDTTVLELGLTGNEAAVVASINSITQNLGFSAIGTGLQLAQGELLANGRPDVDNVIVILTDGDVNEGPDPVVISNQAKAAGTLIFSVGVGEVNLPIVEGIASSPASTYVRVVETFEDLPSVIENLSLTLCAVTGALEVSPSNAVKLVGTTHTVTATVLADGVPLSDAQVSFNIVAGPNAGATGILSPADGLTDANGQSTFTYTSNFMPGIDSILVTATVPGPDGPVERSKVATVEWNSTVTGPVVVSLTRFGVHSRDTVLVARFVRPMDAVRAAELTNYTIVDPGRDNRFNTRDDKLIPIRSVVYDPETYAVTIRPAKSLSLHKNYRLVINGRPPGGLTDTTGMFLGGRGPDQPGTDFNYVFGREILAPHGGEPPRPRRTIAPVVQPRMQGFPRPRG